METRLAYTLLIALVGIERLIELRIANRNAAQALANGGREFGTRHYKVMTVLHTSFLLSCLLEVWLLQRPFHLLLGTIMLVVVGATMGLRYWIVATLKERWNTRVIILPDAVPVDTGPYRFMRHPNYVGVIFELAAIPLVHGAWLTAVIFSLANAALLFVRIRVEEQALSTWHGYGEVMGHKPRFLPWS